MIACAWSQKIGFYFLFTSKNVFVASLIFNVASIIFTLSSNTCFFVIIIAAWSDVMNFSYWSLFTARLVMTGLSQFSFKTRSVIMVLSRVTIILIWLKTLCSSSDSSPSGDECGWPWCWFHDLKLSSFLFLSSFSYSLLNIWWSPRAQTASHLNFAHGRLTHSNITFLLNHYSSITS